MEAHLVYQHNTVIAVCGTYEFAQTLAKKFRDAKSRLDWRSPEPNRWIGMARGCITETVRIERWEVQS